jgi:hypothetical protein
VTEPAEIYVDKDGERDENKVSIFITVKAA